MPLFSVVIPVYNRAHLLGDTLDCVFAQTETDFEVVVVDDGSTDGTVAVVREYEEEHSDTLTILRQENQGPGAARNAGIDAASGDYVVFLDSDDHWFPWTLATYRTAIEQFDAPSFMSASVLWNTKEEEWDDVEAAPFEASYYADFLGAAGRGEFASSGTAAVRREVVRELGGFVSDQINAEDHDFAFRLGTAPGFVKIHDPVMVGVRKHDDQLTQNWTKTYQGFSYLLDQEEKGHYPGGEDRLWERRYLLCQHIRSASLEGLRVGDWRGALALYRRTLPWQLRFGRLKYVLGFWGVGAWETVRALWN